jgi:hypothetical protein
MTEFTFTTYTDDDGMYATIQWYWLAYSPIFESLLSSFNAESSNFMLA